MKTLLTGAGGYIGLHILRELLADGQQVTAVVRSANKLLCFGRMPQLRVVEADLEDDSWLKSTLPGHDVCIHAAIIWGDVRAELQGRDAAITSKLFDAAGIAGLKRGIFLSSTAVHRPFIGVMSEEDGLSATDLYSANKAAGELFLRAACSRHQMTGIVVRPGPVVGLPAFDSGVCRTPKRLAEMVSAAAERNLVEAVSGDGRQFADVSTVARLIRILTRKTDPYPTYLCADQEILTWEQIAQMVATYADFSVGVRILPGNNLGPIPRFRTQRVGSLLGDLSTAESAMRAHIQYLTRSMRITPPAEKRVENSKKQQGHSKKRLLACQPLKLLDVDGP